MKKIENIFSFKQIKTPCPNPKTPIIIDTREKNSNILANLYEHKANIKQQKLEIGDYSIGEIVAERKTINDLIGSLKTGHLHNQLKQLKQYNKPLIILEKKDAHSQMHPNAINGIIISIILHHNIPIIYTNSEKHTTQILIQIAKRQQKQPQTNKTKIPDSLQHQKQYILESFPNIGPTASKKLLKKFSSLKEIFNSEKKQIETLLPTKTINSFHKLLNDNHTFEHTN